jgi:hypothetical protein
MKETDRKEKMKRVVQRALQEWRSLKRDNQRSATEVALDLKERAFREIKEGTFAFKKAAE